jgi:hypothetical protein
MVLLLNDCWITVQPVSSSVQGHSRRTPGLGQMNWVLRLITRNKLSGVSVDAQAK